MGRAEAEAADCGVVGAADANGDTGVCPWPLGWPGPAPEGVVISGARYIRLEAELFTAAPSGEGWIWACKCECGCGC